MEHTLYTCHANHLENITSRSPLTSMWTNIHRAQPDMTQYYHLLSVNADSDEQQIIYWDQSDNRLKTGSYRLCCSKELWRLNFQPNHSSSTTTYDDHTAAAHIFEIDMESSGNPFNLRIRSPQDDMYYYWYINKVGYVDVQTDKTAGFLLYKTAQCQF